MVELAVALKAGSGMKLPVRTPPTAIGRRRAAKIAPSRWASQRDQPALAEMKPHSTPATEAKGSHEVRADRPSTHRALSSDQARQTDMTTTRPRVSQPSTGASGIREPRLVLIASSGRAGCRAVARA